MGIIFGIQKDHSKSYTLNIKVPDPIVTFSNFPSDAAYYRGLQNDIQYIMQASLHELPSDYWSILNKLSEFLGDSQSKMLENILNSSLFDKDIGNRLEQLPSLRSHATTLTTIFKMSLNCAIIPKEDQELATCAGREILRYFSDEFGLLFKYFSLTTPFLVVFAGIYQTFVKFWVHQGQCDEEMTLLGVTVTNYANKCIQERLDNIKMLRTQSESYNLHGYSYEAQIRKDVTFGGKINDFYDKRSIDEITFRSHPLNAATDADLILDGYKNEVRREYELFFGSFLLSSTM